MLRICWALRPFLPPALSQYRSASCTYRFWESGIRVERVTVLPEEMAREAFRLAAHKLPVKCKVIKKESVSEAGGEQS